MQKEEVTEHLGKVVKILLIVGIVAALFLFGPAIKNGLLNLVYKSMQADIRISPTTIEEWARPDAVEVFSAELIECGFEPIGDFTINQSSRVKIRAFMHRSRNIYAMVSDKYHTPALLDFYSFYEDGRSVRYTTAKNPHKSKPDNKTIWYIEDPLSIQEIVDKMVARRPEGILLPVSAESFPPSLERDMEEISLWESGEFMQ